ncbi:MAG: putative Holliday junction resolvase YggF [Steroidobacteraceae bacterium]|jgi:putative Holliday junction resolvase|nr:putative Holliday junction resolvase YggF [Steroidobacteraceae bacterium]
MPDQVRSQPIVVLALDFGLKRIGIASGDTLTRAAHPRTTISNGPKGPDWPALDRVLADTRPARIAVGEPYNADGSVSGLTEAARGFAAELAQRSHLPVDLVDERWSSQDAEERLRGARASGERRRRVTREDVDAAAAAVILERWFEQGR